MSKIRINSIEIENYRSFGEKQIFHFPHESHKKPVAIVGYNNSGKTNLMNGILYAIGEKFVSRDTFCINDFHKRNIDNVPYILLNADSSVERKYDGKGAILRGYHKLIIQTDGNQIEGSKIQALSSLNKVQGWNGEEKDDENYQAFGAGKYFNIFYINFHNIKDEISTQKTSWGNLKGFLAKHIKKIVDSDYAMEELKPVFNAMAESSTDFVLSDSKLLKFVEDIKKNYSQNLRDNNCEVSFGMPDYEDIFSQMIFKVGLNGDMGNLIPIEHFGDGYISMFVMAVIQAIAESNMEDRCLFLFEEPESFLHENHQEYFYKMVLCQLADKGHQVIYTTHSDKMVDIFDTKSLIRLEMDEENKTINKYNDIRDFDGTLTLDASTGEVITIAQYNEFIKTIEPSLNRILFSRKVILVEGPNDLMVYKWAIEKKVKERIQSRSDILDKERFAQTYLNFNNISIIPHYGKATAILLIELCKYINLDYFTINDWDFDDDFIAPLSELPTEESMKQNPLYTESDEKAKITTNWKLIHHSGAENIHFNLPKIEQVIGYSANDKNSLKIWELLQSIVLVDEKLFPESLELFLEIDSLSPTPAESLEVLPSTAEEIPF